METGGQTVRQRDSWQRQRKHCGKTQQPPPTNERTDNSRAPHRSQRLHKDRLLPFTFLCVETCYLQQRLFWQMNMRAAEPPHTNTHMQSRRSDHAPHRHVSLLWPLKHMHRCVCTREYKTRLRERFTDWICK